MKWLADENVEYVIIQYLRTSGFDVKSVAEELQNEADSTILEVANLEHRILLTIDKDFGELAFLRQDLTTGITLLRYRTEDSSIKRDCFARFLDQYGHDLEGKFIVLRETGSRIKKLR